MFCKSVTGARTLVAKVSAHVQPSVRRGQLGEAGIPEPCKRPGTPDLLVTPACAARSAGFCASGSTDVDAAGCCRALVWLHGLARIGNGQSRLCPRTGPPILPAKRAKIRVSFACLLIFYLSRKSPLKTSFSGDFTNWPILWGIKYPPQKKIMFLII